MPLDTSIPGCPEIDEWPVTPAFPVSVAQFDRYRDGGPMGGTAFAILQDANQQRYAICFDRFLGRLCFGGTHTNDSDVAFVRGGSALERSILSIMKDALSSTSSPSGLREAYTRALHWSQSGK